MSLLSQLPLKLQQLIGLGYYYCIKHGINSLKAFPGRFKLAGLRSHLHQSNGQQLSKSWYFATLQDP